MESANIIVQNIFFSETLEPSSSLSGQFVNGSWALLSGIRFPPGSAEIQPAFTNPADEDRNYWSLTERAILFFFGGIIVALGISLLAWVTVNRHAAVMTASQPGFLLMIATGCVVSTSSVFFLGWDENSLSMSQLNTFCNVSWWMFSIGLTLITTGFIFKLYRILRLFKKVKRLRQNVIKIRTLVAGVILMLVMNISVLFAWSIVDPLIYLRVPVQFDTFGQTTESVGYCQINSATSYIFIVLLVLLHVGQYIFGITVAVKTRNIPPDFQEAKWVVLAFFSQIQLTALGVPILFAIDEQDADIRFLTSISLTCLLNLSILTLLFAPKYYRLKYGQEGVEIYTEESRRTQTGGIRIIARDSLVSETPSERMQRISKSGL